LFCGALVSLAVPIGVLAAGLLVDAWMWTILSCMFGAALALSLRHALLPRIDSALASQRSENLRFHTAINNMQQGLCFFDGQQRLIVCNQLYADMYKLTLDQVRPGTTLRKIVEYRHASGCIPDMSREAYMAWRDAIAIADKPSNTVSTLLDGRTIAIHHQPMPDGGWVATHEDITEHRRAQAEIEHMAHHDALTGLANRALFCQRLTSSLQSGHHPIAVMYLDLDRFKAVNDTLGHASGDQLLRMAADRLIRCVRKGDLVARLGGDEFAIIQFDDNQPKAAEALASRLRHAVAAPFEISEQQVTVGASIGIALSDAEDGIDHELLLMRADMALYDAKSNNRGTHSFFRPELDRRAKGRCEMKTELHQAIEQGGSAAPISG
jgi:diguanylate cyclase (GGDEF)-like protein